MAMRSSLVEWLIILLQSEWGGAKSRHGAALAQLVRALDCGSRGPPFEPGTWYHFKSRH